MSRIIARLFILATIVAVIMIPVTALANDYCTIGC